MRKMMGASVLLAGMMLAAAPAQAAIAVLDITGVTSNDDFGTGGNVIRTLLLGAGSTINSVTLNANYSTSPNNNSYLNEASLAIGPTSDPTFLTGSFSSTPSGGTENFSSTFNPVGLTLDGDGVLRFEFFENFDDEFGAPDGTYNTGQITVDYSAAAAPGPGAPAPLLGLGLMPALAAAGGLTAARRRRKAARA